MYLCAVWKCLHLKAVNLRFVKKSFPDIEAILVHDDVIKWKHILCYWPFVRGTHRSPVISPHKGQWRGALLFSLIYAWINGWVNHGEASDFRRHLAHYDVTVMRNLRALSATWRHPIHTKSRQMSAYWIHFKQHLLNYSPHCTGLVCQKKWFVIKCWKGVKLIYSLFWSVQ